MPELELPANIVLTDDTSYETAIVDRKPVIIIHAGLVNITIPATLLRDIDQTFADQGGTKVRGCTCGYCGTSCAPRGRKGVCYCGQCELDCWY